MYDTVSALDSDYDSPTLVEFVERGSFDKLKYAGKKPAFLQEKSGFSFVVNALSSLGMARARAGSRLPLYDAPVLRKISQSPSPSRTSKPLRTRRSTLSLLQQAKYSKFWRPRTIKHLLKYAFVLACGILFCFTFFWETHVEISFYSRRWVEKEVKAIEPLSGCFDSSRISPKYNISRAFGPKYQDVQAGIPLRLGMDCYDFAGTIRPLPRHAPQPSEPVERIMYHTYWRTDLVKFGERQEWMLKSFFATQDLSRSLLVLWTNGDLRHHERVRPWLEKYPNSFRTAQLNVHKLARGTALEGSPLLKAQDDRAWVDGDLIRLLVTWAHGGVWIDMDSLMTRDLSPLLEHEFVTQWDCYDKPYQPFNGAVMHFFQHSPYLCEAFEIMSRSPEPRSGTTEWGSLLYLKLWRRIIAAEIPPFKILPFCFTDARSCRLDNRLPDPFKKDGLWAGGFGMQEGGPLDDALSKIFSVHLHNQWSKAFPTGGWVDRLLLKRYDRALSIEHSPPGNSNKKSS